METISCSDSSTAIAPFLLEKDKNNYEDWKVYVKNYLLAQDLWDIVEYGNTQEGNWRKKNAAALHAILSTCSQDIFSQIKDSSAKDAWNHIAKMHEEWQHPDEEAETGVEGLVRGEEVDQTMHEGRPKSKAKTETSVEGLGRGVNSEEFVKLVKRLYHGDQKVARHVLDKHPTFPSITGFGETALHVTIKAEKDEIAKQLIEMMSKQDLEKKDCNGHTSLSYVAFQGRTNLAKILVPKNRDLLTIVDNAGNIPLTRACGVGHKEMTDYLYNETPSYFLEPGKQDNHGFHLVRCCIANKMFGLEAKLPPTANREVRLVVTDQGHDEKNIRKRVFNGFHGLGLKVQEFFGIKTIYDLKLKHLYALKVLRCMCKHVSALELNHQRDDFGVGAALFEATKQGIVEFVTELWKANPSFGFKTNHDNRLAFMVAVQYRQEKVFNLIYGVNQAWKAENLNKSDSDGNNILHVAGGLAPDFERVGISSPALQMQRELQWFKEVEKIVPEWCKEAKNDNGETPKDVFTKSHKELVKEGAKWMRDTSSSFIIVSILLVTIMFAVAFTVPGGNNQETGLPVLLGEKLFMVFIITEAISFFTASTSGLMFLGILTSRQAEEDFHVSLPKKLMIGLFTLFVSIATMMASFCAALLIVLEVQRWAVILVLSMASIPVTLFVWSQFPLLVEISVSTYALGIFKKKMNRWLIS
ncbi:hypothetical protein SLEP1_g37749 [Rubroshorea leprosula]|uniref:PGG domain-containing protein n=1 Tax=Rubroshorea leprosula TaxID=152421 RepID=A0AAV5KVM3_9ROSI|nr:hypothetical protein SLEP1_g37749 [Rubroshorea leprosula]